MDTRIRNVDVKFIGTFSQARKSTDDASDKGAGASRSVRCDVHKLPRSAPGHLPMCGLRASPCAKWTSAHVKPTHKPRSMWTCAHGLGHARGPYTAYRICTLAENIIPTCAHVRMGTCAIALTGAEFVRPVMTSFVQRG